MAGDLGRFKGMLPYASELFGVYQPLLGWKSTKAKRRVDGERNQNVGDMVRGMQRDSRFRNLVQQSLMPHGPDDLLPPRLPEWLVGSVGAQLSKEIEGFISKQGRLPSGAEWTPLMEGLTIDKVQAAQGGAPGAGPGAKGRPGAQHLVLLPRSALTDAQLQQLETFAVEGTDLVATRLDPGRVLTLQAHESVAAGTLKYLSVNSAHLIDSILQRDRANWQVLKPFVDPLANFDPATQLAVLSPIGVVQLYREYFFEFDSFLGPPVGHVWVSPGGTLELYETHTQKTFEERQIEATLDVSVRSQTETTTQDELSSAVSESNARNTSLGFSVSSGENFGVVQSSASANMGMTQSHQTAEQKAHKHSRQQSERLATEIRRNYKTTFRTSVEAQDTSSRRYVLQNTTDKLVNYELRRKMRQLGVQVQHIGSQLCWQAYVDDPGTTLGVGELVHAAKPDDAGSALQPPEAPAPLEAKEGEATVQFAFAGIGGNDDTDANYVNGRDGDGNQIVPTQEFAAVAPGAGYELAGVSLTSVDKVDSSKDAPLVNANFVVKKPSNFVIQLNGVNFHGQPEIQFTLKLVWQPTAESVQATMTDYQKKLAAFTEQSKRDAYNSFVQAVRDRVKAATTVTARSATDLRDEERTVVYRQLIRQLMQVGDQRTPHVTAELIRSLFDVDEMLYFVAPDWWMPRLHSEQQVGAVFDPTATGIPDATDGVTVLTDANTVGWGGVGDPRRDNYLITEDSQPAPMGASLGWLLQLDGDRRRNAFLNSPWVKAVIPIQAGKEEAALNWLKLAHVEGSDGLDAPYGGPEPELAGLTIEQALGKLAESIRTLNTDAQGALATEQVFEHGFDPLETGFRATGTPYEVFDQWIEVLPTDQVVAVEYQPPVEHPPA